MVIMGWIFDISVLKSIYPDWISMKFVTAGAFLLSGVSLYFMARGIEGDFDGALVVLSITSLTITLLMGILFFSTLLSVHTGVEDMFVKETRISTTTVSPGLPSGPTMVNFLLIALAGIFFILDHKNVRQKLKIIGLTVGLVGAVAIVGYGVNTPLLYYFIQGTNSAMACHTAILFVLMGLGLLCL